LRKFSTCLEDGIDGRKVTDGRWKKRIPECLQEGEGIATRKEVTCPVEAQKHSGIRGHT